MNKSKIELKFRAISSMMKFLPIIRALPSSPYKIKFICPFPSFSLSFLPLIILFCLVATILITRRESNRNSRYRRRKAMARASIWRVLMASLRSKGSFSVNTALVRGDSYRISYRRHTDGNAHADTSA